MPTIHSMPPDSAVDRAPSAGLHSLTPFRTKIAAALATASWALAASLAAVGSAAAAGSYQIYVSDERSDEVTVIDGGDFSVVGAIPVGKRPRGIHASPDGRFVYVALSGTPIAIPPQLDAHGNPIFKRGGDDDDNESASDKGADGIGIIDVAHKRLKRKIFAGSDPEEFALSKDGTQLYVSNEDTKSASVVKIAASKVEHIIPVGQEPEGVATTPDGKQFYVTCESGGDVYVVDTKSYSVVGHFKVDPRPRTVAFLPNVAFVPSESVGELNVVDSKSFKPIKVITLPAGSRPMSVRVSPDGQSIYVSNGRGGTVSVIDAHTYAVGESIKVGTRPWGMAISPDGKYLFTANGPSDDVSVVDLKTNQEIKRVKAGKSPWSVAIVRQR